MQCNCGMWMVCGSNTPPDEGANSPHLGVSRSELNALWKVSDQHFQKTVRTHPLRSTFAGGSRSPSSKKLAVAKPRPSPGTETCSDLRTKTANALGLKAIASEIEKQLAHHAHLTTNLHCAAHAEKQCKLCELRNKCFKTSSANLLRDSFRWPPSIVQEPSALLRQNCCWRFTPAASRRHVQRRIQIHCVTPCHLSI